MNSVESEANTAPAQSFIDEFFTKLPIDTRFHHIEVMKFLPRSMVNENVRQINFSLEKRLKPYCYMIGDIMMECHVKIKKADNTDIDAAKYVAPVNSCLHALFSKVVVKINNTQISTTPDYYEYRSYLNNLMSFDPETKASSLSITGWATDSASCMDGEMNETAGVPKNTGFLTRNGYFRRNFLHTGPSKSYKAEGAVFFGKLNHELVNCGKVLPPEIPVSIELHRTSDAFYLMTEKTGDTEKYKAVLTDICLYVPVAHLNFSLMRHLEMRWETTPIVFHYRRVCILPLSVPRHKSVWVSDNLFAESENPCRVFFAFVETEAFRGHYQKNPFEFRRKWKGDFSESVPVDQTTDRDRMWQREMQRQSDKLDRLYALLENRRDPEDEPLSNLASGRSQVSAPAPPRMATRSGRAQESSTASFAANPIEPQPTTSGFMSRLSTLFNRRQSDSSDFEVLPTLEQVEQARHELDRLERQVAQSAAPSLRDDRSDVEDPIGTTTEFWVNECALQLNNVNIG